MSMLDVAKYLSYSRSVDNSKDRERIFNLKLANSGRLFSCLYGDRTHWNFGREQDRNESVPTMGKEI
ncbi:hypothetical protein [Pontiella sp.]|uniref:hypothetical protein n=1 Tax=Pontiella sp. TaxID=2837462 RepID=UPI00356ACC52